MIPMLDLHREESQLQLMFVGKVCKECGTKATVLINDAEDNETFFCSQHAPANCRKWWINGNDK